jgi:hypothetical protein
MHLTEGVRQSHLKFFITEMLRIVNWRVLCHTLLALSGLFDFILICKEGTWNNEKSIIPKKGKKRMNGTRLNVHKMPTHTTLSWTWFWTPWGSRIRPRVQLWRFAQSHRIFRTRLRGWFSSHDICIRRQAGCLSQGGRNRTRWACQNHCCRCGITNLSAEIASSI